MMASIVVVGVCVIERVTIFVEVKTSGVNAVYYYQSIRSVDGIDF